jgi:hypothetical protein
LRWSLRQSKDAPPGIMIFPTDAKDFSGRLKADDEKHKEGPNE